MKTDATIEAALGIAVEGLRWCYTDKGILTGSRGVYWSWDSFFASKGALCIEDQQMVKKNLDLYLMLINKQGNVPRRIAHPYYFWKYLGFPISEAPHKQKPTYWNTYYTAPSLAQNPTFIIALYDYVETTGDMEYFKGHQGEVERVMHYLASHEGEFGLLKEGIGGGWSESILKRGAIAFTNMCYARAAWCLGELYTKAKNKERAEHYQSLFKVIKDAINVILWSDSDGGFYSDWYGHRRHHHFATDGNLLAILWGISSPRQTACIQKVIDQLALEDDVPIRLVYGKYSFWRIYFSHWIGGIKDYHVGFCWTWLGCIDVLAKVQLGQKEAAHDTLLKIAKVIARDGTVYETYDRGKPIHTFFYKSERPWGWGAGLFIAACYALGYRYNKHT